MAKRVTKTKGGVVSSLWEIAPAPYKKSGFLPKNPLSPAARRARNRGIWFDPTRKGGGG